MIPHCPRISVGSDWTTPFELAPFAKISDDDFAPALDEALQAHSAQIDAIAANAEAPSFANTIETLEAAGEQLDKVLSVFFTVAGADSNPKREELQRELTQEAFRTELTGIIDASEVTRTDMSQLDPMILNLDPAMLAPDPAMPKE